FAEEKHRALATELNDAANRSADRLGAQSADQSERLRAALAGELAQLRAGIEASKLAQAEGLSAHRQSSQQTLAELGAALQTRLADQARADQELPQNTLRHNSAQLGASIEAMTRAVDGRLEQIS